MTLDKMSVSTKTSLINQQKRQTQFFGKILSLLGPLVPLISFYLFGLMLFFVFRVALLIKYFDRVVAIDNYFLIFPIGLRMDTIFLCYSLIIPFLFLLILPAKTVKKTFWIFSLYLTLILALSTFLEIATFPYMAEFETRPDRLFLEHIVQMREVFTMIFKGYFIELLIGLSVTLIVGLIVFRFFQKLFREYRACTFTKRVVLFLIITPILFIGARSSFGHRPANISTAAFSKSHLANQLALNSIYSLVYASYSARKHEKDIRKIYGKMDSSEMLRQIRMNAFINDEDCTNLDGPLLHYQKARFSHNDPLNLVIILEESLGAEYVGCLGGLPLTPNIDRLSKEGLLLTNLYATGTRTVRAIEAIVSGFLPTAGRSVVKLGYSQNKFFTVASLLRSRGYTTEFIYGGESHFDNMRSFFLGNGFDTIYDENNFEKPIFRGTWGVSDEDLFNKANHVFKSHGDAPFFALILTTSNHDPFEFPDGRIELYEQPKMTRHNAMKYADYALGQFFKTAKKESYYKNTIFLIIADHSTRLRGQDLIPIHKFHIPGLIIGPHVEPGEYEKIASQIDMAPTLLDLMGISSYHPLIGRPLLSLPDNISGRAIMQYGTTHAFMVDNQVIIHRPLLEPLQFTYKDGRLIQSDIDSELLNCALAHALLPGYLYYNRLYFLPDGGT